MISTGKELNTIVDELVDEFPLDTGKDYSKTI